MISKINTLGLFAANGFSVTAECFISGGLPNFDIVGLPDTAVRESRDRVRAAIKSLGAKFPDSRVTVNLAPADMKKEGAIYDLPILLSILEASEMIPKIAEKSAFLGELSLSGELRRARGVLPMALSAKEEGIKYLFVPKENAKEASLVGEDIEVYGAESVRDIIYHIKGEKKLKREPMWKPGIDEYCDELDFRDVRGQENVKRALEIAAAGGHNILLVGPPGSGKSMLAARIPSILPEMTYEESLETTKIHSLLGLITDKNPLVVKRPFRSPHHSSSAVAISGGGTALRPGEISLAHNGVLFLDELPEFHRDSLETLRQPMETGTVTISRSSGSATYPADFMLVCAMNPCKCGWYGCESGPHVCTCTKLSRDKYMGKISGPLLDRIDIQVNVSGVSFADMSGERSGDSSAEIRERARRARLRAHARGAVSNAALSPKRLHECCILDDDAKELLREAFDTLGFTGRSYDKILRVALTISDLAGADTISIMHVAEAIQYRSLDRKED